MFTHHFISYLAKPPPLPPPPTPNNRLSSAAILIKAALGRDLDVASAGHLLKLLPLPLHTHIIETTCSSKNKCTPLESSVLPNRLGAAISVAKLMLGYDVNSVDLDRVAAMLPLTLFDYVRMFVCRPTWNVMDYALGFGLAIIGIMSAMMFFFVFCNRKATAATVSTKTQKGTRMKTVGVRKTVATWLNRITLAVTATTMLKNHNRQKRFKAKRGKSRVENMVSAWLNSIKRTALTTVTPKTDTIRNVSSGKRTKGRRVVDIMYWLLNAMIALAAIANLWIQTPAFAPPYMVPGEILLRMGFNKPSPVSPPRDTLFPVDVVPRLDFLLRCTRVNGTTLPECSHLGPSPIVDSHSTAAPWNLLALMFAAGMLSWIAAIGGYYGAKCFMSSFSPTGAIYLAQVRSIPANGFATIYTKAKKAASDAINRNADVIMATMCKMRIPKGLLDGWPTGAYHVERIGSWWLHVMVIVAGVVYLWVQMPDFGLQFVVPSAFSLFTGFAKDTANPSSHRVRSAVFSPLMDFPRPLRTNYTISPDCTDLVLSQTLDSHSGTVAQVIVVFIFAGIAVIAGKYSANTLKVSSTPVATTNTSSVFSVLMDGSESNYPNDKPLALTDNFETSKLDTLVMKYPLERRADPGMVAMLGASTKENEGAISEDLAACYEPSVPEELATPQATVVDKEVVDVRGSVDSSQCPPDAVLGKSSGKKRRRKKAKSGSQRA